MKKYDNYVANLNVLEGAADQDLSNEFVASGIISKFSLQFELAWKLLKETLAYEGVAEAASGSPRQIAKAAFAAYDFLDEDVWLDMLRARSAITHTYDGETVRELVRLIIEEYTPAFIELRQGLEGLYGDTLFAEEEAEA